MTSNELTMGLIGFIEKQVMPTCTGLEKGIIIGLPLLGIFNIEQRINQLLTSPLLENSNIWLDEGKTQINGAMLKEFANKWLASCGGTYTYGGYELDLGFQKVNLFGGLKITEQTVNDLFSPMGV